MTNCGVRVYPVAYSYDAQGRMALLTTWTNFTNGSGTSAASWLYDGYRGWLTNKLYADGKGPLYSYTLAGRLAVRSWARGTRTTNAYDAAGNLLTVTYNDGTPDMTNVYDRRGRLVGVTNGTAARPL